MSSSTFYLVIHSGYHAVMVALYQDTQSIANTTLDKKEVSAFLISTITQLLTQHEKKISDLSFMAVHAGPAPFTTLRVAITTANGMSFATNLPLVPVSGLEELSLFYPDATVLFNAFCGDLYIGKQGKVWCQSAETFFEEIKNETHPPTFIGNAVPLFEKIIREKIPHAHIPADYPYEASLDMIAQRAYIKWQNKTDITHQVIPLYLKAHSAKINLG